MENTIEEKRKKVVSREEIHERTTGYILTALGLVAGLAWNDAVSSFIKYFFPVEGNGIIIKFVYAIVLTIVIIFVSNSLLRIMTRSGDRC